MRYYVISDVHGFYTNMTDALKSAGYFDDSQPHKLIILGDLFDRGTEALALQSFVTDLLDRDAVILVRGNHEDLFEKMITEDHGIAYQHHVSNGTFDTALQLTGHDPVMAGLRNYDFANAAMATPYYQKIIPAMVNYYETAHYVFVHGWVPGVFSKRGYNYFSGWRDCPEPEWAAARWFNGMACISSTGEEKTIVCGHWHASYGHSRIEEKGSEFGPDADFTPYYGNGIIALDACTAVSGFVNCILIEDRPLR